MAKKTSPSVDERLTTALELIAAKFAEYVDLTRRRLELEEREQLIYQQQADGGRTAPEGPIGLAGYPG